ncbi:BFD-like (2Fe-2S) protein [Xenococcus sp. PCC 7305]|uniref:putative iron-sulfur cluster-binding metallochaperone n=1 Tax=Xenococcus sp. PCC 7305 TaxID=102125 RepID=UPI0002ACF646|nr:copper chaperone Copz family protein [Xenococcus sp. PCC 7305]ELS02920.1 BFD-like (2Fe-2S) protein [Xenococcus sp. PCC 7305]
MTETCCCPPQQTSWDKTCPIDGTKGKRVQTITLKSLLIPSALETLNSDTNYYFCTATDCPVVYFNEEGQIFSTKQGKELVFQKDKGLDVPVCYCFGWSRDRIQREIIQTSKSSAEANIRSHIKAGRCGCEVNNPQGSCCLGNIRAIVRQLSKNIPT